MICVLAILETVWGRSSNYEPRQPLRHRRLLSWRYCYCSFVSHFGWPRAVDYKQAAALAALAAPYRHARLPGQNARLRPQAGILDSGAD
jgi:hypothetical protein